MNDECLSHRDLRHALGQCIDAIDSLVVLQAYNSNA